MMYYNHFMYTMLLMLLLYVLVVIKQFQLLIGIYYISYFDVHNRDSGHGIGSWWNDPSKVLDFIDLLVMYVLLSFCYVCSQ